MCLVIVPETTAFYRTSFEDDKDFTTQLKKVYEDGQTKNPNIKIKASDKYLVLSTCREEDETIRSNLYLRQIPDSEMKDFVAKHADQLTYVATRGQQYVLKDLALLSLFCMEGLLQCSFDVEQKMGIWLVLLRWGPNL